MRALFGMVISILLVLSMIPAIAFTANAASFVSIDDVELNGVEVKQGQSIFVERGSRANVRVEFRPNADAKNVKVRAWIGGYEHGNIQDVQGPFDINAGVTKIVNLGLGIPEDIEASKEYQLRVEVFNENNEDKFSASVKLDVEEKRHAVELFDVLFTPGLTVDAGEPIFVNVRLKNRGGLDEKDIRVSVRIPELGVEQAVYVDKLVPEAQEDRNTASSASTNDIFVQIPVDTAKKNYRMVVAVAFNGRRDKTEKEYTLTVNGVATHDLEDSRIMVSAQETVKNVAPGKTSVYIVNLANLNSESKVLIPEIVGLKGWASVDTEPRVLSIGSGEVSQMLVKVTPVENAAGERVFVLKFIENGRTVKEVSLRAVVGGAAVTGVTGTAGTALTSGLGIVFIVLLVILVILGIVIAVKRGRTEAETAAEGGETKSYY